MADAEDTLARLDAWSEANDASVLISRRLDLSRPAPEEWVCILTWGEQLPPVQASGAGMSPRAAINWALDAAGKVLA